jgi:hypothetical protein
MLLDLLGYMKDAELALRRTTHVTQTLDVVTPDQIAAYSQLDAQKVQKGLELLTLAGRVCHLGNVIALPVHTQVKLRPNSLQEFCRDAVLSAIKEYFPASGLRAGGVIKLHTLMCFLPDWVDLEEGLRWLDVECCCRTENGIKLTPELLVRLVVTRTNYLN